MRFLAESLGYLVLGFLAVFALLLLTAGFVWAGEHHPTVTLVVVGLVLSYCAGMALRDIFHKIEGED